jgi:hypothetical protein
VIAEPPSVDGAIQVMVADPFPSVALKLVGAPGIERGVTDEVETGSPEPALFNAVMRNCSAVPFVRPDT